MNKEVLPLAISDKLTLRERTVLKMDASMQNPDGIEFSLLEARLAGAFVENALTLDDVIDDYESDEDSEDEHHAFS